MTMRRIPDEALMALADNELPAAEAAELRAAIADDPDAAERLAMFAETRMLVSGSDRDDVQVSDALRSAVLQADARYPEPARAGIGSLVRAPFGGRPRDPAARPNSGEGFGGRRWHLPMAAALLLSVGGLSGYLVAQLQRVGDNAAHTALMMLPGAERALAAALDTAASGSETSVPDGTGEGMRIVMLSTHRLADGTFCREFEIRRAQQSLLAASCRRNNAWRTEIAVVRDRPQGGLAPASGAAVVDDHLSTIGSEGALSPEEERAAMARGWSQR